MIVGIPSKDDFYQELVETSKNKLEQNEELKKECDFIAIRLLHAKKAESILDQLFKRDNGTTFYIIDDIYATGNTARAIKQTIEDLGGNILGTGVVINIKELIFIRYLIGILIGYISFNKCNIKSKIIKFKFRCKLS